MHSDNTFPVLFPVIVVAGFIAFLVFLNVRAKKRTAALAGIAQTIGFNFEGEDWADPSREGWLTTALFQMGSNRRFMNIMTGSFAGLDTSLFDYLFTTGAGKSAHTWNQTVVAFSQDLWLPQFALRAENILDRIGEAFTHEDIDFDSHPKFSHRYLLRGADEAKIRELFTPALLDFLENIPAKEKWHIEGAGKNLILYLSDVTIAPEHLQSFLEITSSMAKTFLSSCGRSSFLSSTRTF